MSAVATVTSADAEWWKAIARCGARVWADYLRKDVTPDLVHDAGYGFRGNDALDDPEETRRGELGNMLLGLVKKGMARLTNAQVDRFEDELEAGILAAQKEGFRFGCTIMTDYHPDRIITEAMARAGIDTDRADYRFPFKTSVYLREDGVTIKQGYAAPEVTLVETKRSSLAREIQSLAQAESPYREAAYKTSTEEERARFRRRQQIQGELVERMPVMFWDKRSVQQLAREIWEATAEVPGGIMGG